MRQGLQRRDAGRRRRRDGKEKAWARQFLLETKMARLGGALKVWLHVKELGRCGERAGLDRWNDEAGGEFRAAIKGR